MLMAWPPPYLKSCKEDYETFTFSEKHENNDRLHDLTLKSPMDTGLLDA